LRKNDRNISFLHQQWGLVITMRVLGVIRDVAASRRILTINKCHDVAATWKADAGIKL
tara:strand:- start:1689 stop:1862 length:174 start_codon:yes stop_codon:yes gene_type:complete